MIYTTYFANLRKLPDNVIPISICGKAPPWYQGLQYKKLAPKYDFFMEWKKNQDNDYYVEHYQAEVLDCISTATVIRHLEVMLRDVIEGTGSRPFTKDSKWHIALVCYETPDKFCHRHLVAEWLRNDGWGCEELEC